MFYLLLFAIIRLLKKGDFMESFNAYEKALILQNINPKICYIANTNSEYLDNLRQQYGADISFFGIRPERIDLSIFKNCDVIILETEGNFSESFYNFLIDLGGIISYKENKKVSMVYSFKKSDGSTKVCSYNSVSWMFKDMGSIDGDFESRDLLDIGIKLYLNSEKNNSFVKSFK